MKKHTTNKKSDLLFGFFYKYWATAILTVVLIILIRQNLFINQFPFSLSEKQQIIDEEIDFNQALDKKNNIKMIELKMATEPNMEVLESQARYRFGLIKAGETYYQINELVPNSP